MTAYGQIPAHVLESAERRLRAGRKPRICAIDGCGLRSTHSPMSGHDACETHRILPAPPVSDPARRLYALRDKAAAERALLEEQQLLTVRINYVWASEAARQEPAA